MRNYTIIVVIAVTVLVCLGGVRGEVVMEWVAVGNPGNAGEWSGENYSGVGPDRICGAVDYEYSIGKYEVTAGQYCEFLNAVAADDPHGLYDPDMDEGVWGCQITRNGSAGSYTYDFSGRPSGTEADWVNRPVNCVSWGCAARFANWLHNGQPTGSQDLTTTEDGSYFLDGATSDIALMAIVREPDATWVIPSEDEWYKAAYHKNDGVTGNYWDYPTQSNTVPTWEPPPGTDMINGSANCYWGSELLDPPQAEVGAYTAKPSDSPYGTFDQGGNLNEWNEAVIDSKRASRGGAFLTITDLMHAAFRGYFINPSVGYNYSGFRLAKVAEPDPPGACCYSDGSCSEQLEVNCAGNWFGEGAMCDPNPCPQSDTLYVDNDASLSGDGFSWETAYTYLQDALSVAAAPDSGIIAIHVAQGVYMPDLDEAGNVTLGDRQATFQLIDGVAIMGGYRGCPGGDCLGDDPDERDIIAFESVLSGDLTGNDGPDFANNSENSYHVAFSENTGLTAILDGFTVTAGNANGSTPSNEGAGMYNYFSSPTVSNCAFSKNAATQGGGMSNISSRPLVIRCVFGDNSVGSNGGGLYNDHSSPTMTNCAFNGNSADTFGGGMYNAYDCDPTLVNCTFSGNSATSIGGGIYVFRGAAVITNCTFSGNSAVVRGGGMYNRWGSPALTSCILWGNTAPTGPQISIYSGGTSVTYSCVQDGWSGTGNIGTLPEHDPLFIDADGADDSAGTDDDDLRISEGSPCIDAGSNPAVPLDAADLDQNGDTAERTPLDMNERSRFVDDPDTTDTGLDDLPDYPEIVDMGAYEYSSASDCNDNGVPDEDDIAGGTSLDCNENDIPDECEYPGCAGILPGDMNCDAMTDGADVQGFINYLVSDRYTCPADMNTDGFVAESDIPLFVGQLLGS